MIKNINLRQFSGRCCDSSEHLLTPDHPWMIVEKNGMIRCFKCGTYFKVIPTWWSP